QPNLIVVRTEHPVPQDMKDKIALFCDIKSEEVIESRDVDVIYEMPLRLQEQHMDQIVLDHFGIEAPEADMTEWNGLVEKVKSLKKSVKIGLVGK
ncbi:CTP synthase, partial [Streptococcus pneumoniae]|nr:CTP synthase [Streptococcus pneumoniae]